jgi:AcrR family transcriptional regulator
MRTVSPPKSRSGSRGAARAAAKAPAYHHGDLRNALIKEGRGLLEEKGALALSLREAARRAGVSEAAPSRHFDSKEALLAAIAASGFDELAAERYVIAASDLGSMEKAYRMMWSYVAFARRHMGLFHLMVGPVIIERNAYPELIASSNASFDLFSSAVNTYAQEHGWPRRYLHLITHAAWSVEHGLAMLILSRRIPRAEMPVDLDEMVDFTLCTLLSAITAGPEALKAVMKLRDRASV